MSMEGAAWSSLYKISTARDGKHGISRESVRRIMTFAVPYRSMLLIFISLSIVGAFLAVATPVLAGQVVDVIVARGEVSTIVRLAVVRERGRPCRRGCGTRRVRAPSRCP